MYLASAGMVCSVGLNATAACAAMRAGVASFAELHYRDNRGGSIIGAPVPDLDPDLPRGQRLIVLLTKAVADCIGENPALPTGKIPLLIGLAEPGRPGGGADFAESLLRELQTELGMQFHPQLSRTLTGGHTAGFNGLRVVRELFQNSDVPECVVCAVDSFINARTLLWLEEHSRLKTEANSNGVIPGEAAGAVWVHRQSPDKAQTVVKVLGLGFATEKATILSEEPLLGLGLAEAVRAALAEAKSQFYHIGFRLSDVTGESYGFKEQALAEARLMRAGRVELLPLWHAADSIGDTGAAAGVCQLVMVCTAFQKGYAPGDLALCCTSAVPGDRAVAVLQHLKQGPRE